MLYTEFNLDEAKEVWREEALEEGIGIGREEGIGIGREEKGEEIARNALAKGLSVEFVQEITGFDAETIKGLQAGL